MRNTLRLVTALAIGIVVGVLAGPFAGIGPAHAARKKRTYYCIGDDDYFGAFQRVRMFNPGKKPVEVTETLLDTSGGTVTPEVTYSIQPGDTERRIFSNIVAIDKWVANGRLIIDSYLEYSFGTRDQWQTWQIKCT